MPDDPRILELVEEILESGRTPEDVCTDYPDLLRDVRRSLRRVRSVAAQIDDLFPSTAGASQQAERAKAQDLNHKLPEIPGYLVEGVVGRGGMGIVYKARHLKLNRAVAIKMLLAGVYAGATERARFLREAEAVARLNHPHVVQLHDMGDWDGHAYFTMEFVEGGTLAERLGGAPTSGYAAAAMICTLAEAVEAAHRAGIVHRDLKPGNILLTPDGTPKITDFGLARRVEEDATVTLSGARVGTPSYMAPEQASGKLGVVGPPSDVYALGAIFYEMLTGRPPFKAATASETERQLIEEDPAPPSRLNAKVLPDLETICLKCLQKEPHRRYLTAAELAEDIHRFLRNEPILARRTGSFERSLKWTRRHPTTTVTIVGCTVLSLMLSCGGVWLAFQRINQAHAVEVDLREVALMQQEARWAEARTALDRAEARLGGVGSGGLRQRLLQANFDLDLVEKLDNIRLSRATSGLLAVYRQIANVDYARTFNEARLGTFSDPPAEVAMRINVSAVRLALIAALDDWAFCTTDQVQRDWVLKVARGADPDTNGWNSRILDPANWDNPKALTALSDSVPVDTESLPLLLALGERMTSRGANATPYLRRVQEEHPDDFWANLVLGNSLLAKWPAEVSAAVEAGGYYRVVLALRPEAAVGYCSVGDTFRLEGELDEAIRYYRKSIQIDPQYARGYSNLGLVFELQKKWDDAIDCFHKSIELDPRYAWTYFNLANAFIGQGKLDQAKEQYQKALALDPGNKAVISAMRNVYVPQGADEQVVKTWRQYLKGDPNIDDWWEYAALTLYLGRTDEYAGVRRALLKRFGDSSDPVIDERVGRACILQPGTPDEMRVAVSLIDRAVARKDVVDPWLGPYFMFAKGLADYRQGHFDMAIENMEGNTAVLLGPSPGLILAMAQYRQGQPDAALKSLAAAVADYDWRPSAVSGRDSWMAHVLRREAEAMILLELPAFAQGKYEPRDNDERMALLGYCEFNGLHVAEANLLADAFAADPKLTKDYHSDLRIHIARAAAMAGAGDGNASTLTAAERAAWRDQARQWLRRDLTAIEKESDKSAADTQDSGSKKLTSWLSDPDLAVIRDPDQLAKLSPEERQECNSLWTDVSAVP